MHHNTTTEEEGELEFDEQNIIIKIIYFQIKKKKSVIHMDSTYDNRTNPDNTY